MVNVGLVKVTLVIVPPLMVGEVSVLLVNVSVVALPTSVSAEVGRVNVFQLTTIFDTIVGVVIVGVVRAAPVVAR